MREQRANVSCRIIAIIAGLMSVYAFVWLIIDLHVYWQSGWNFDLPASGYENAASPRPPDVDMRHHLLDAVMFGSFAFFFWGFARRYSINDPRVMQPRPTGRGERLLLIALLGAVVAGILTSMNGH